MPTLQLPAPWTLVAILFPVLLIARVAAQVLDFDAPGLLIVALLAIEINRVVAAWVSGGGHPALI